MHKKTKVLHIAQAAGGVDRYLQSLLKYFDREKFENVLVCSNDFEEKDYKNIVDKFIVVKMQREISAKADFSAIKSVRKIIKNEKPDIVYVHSSKAGAIGRIADFGIKNKVVYNPHGWAFNMDCGNKKKLMYRMIEKFLSPLTNEFVCISDAEKVSAQENKITKDKKLNVILNGIDIENCKKQLANSVTRESLGIKDDAFVIGQVGRLSLQKSPDIFIQSAVKIKEKIKNAHFVLVGDGDMKEEVLSYARENGIENSLTITGWVDNPLSYVGLFDVATLLSRWEGFGLVLPEYMLAKKPIVACGVDAIPTVIDNNKTGVLVNAESPKETADAIYKIYSDSNFRNQLIENGTKAVYEKFDAKRVSLETEKLFLNDEESNNE